MSNHPDPKPHINVAIIITENHLHQGVTPVKTLNKIVDSAIINILLNRSYSTPGIDVEIIFIRINLSILLLSIKMLIEKRFN